MLHTGLSLHVQLRTGSSGHVSANTQLHSALACWAVNDMLLSTKVLVCIVLLVLLSCPTKAEWRCNEIAELGYAGAATLSADCIWPAGRNVRTLRGLPSTTARPPVVSYARDGALAADYPAGETIVHAVVRGEESSSAAALAISVNAL